MTKVSLVGFGRIGRDLFRQSLLNNNIDIVSISDTADKKNLIYLLKYDSIYGKLDATIEESKHGIIVNGRQVLFNNWEDSTDADWKSIGTDVVILATGKPQIIDEVKGHISKGCQKVLIASTPMNFGEVQIYIPGANEESVDFSADAFSLGSNTANAVAPLLKNLNEKVGVERAFLTTVHGYSNSNRLADVAGEGFRLNRAAGENIIPNITKSSDVIIQVLPLLKNKVASSSMTVPVPDGSTVDLTIDLKNETSIDQINKLIEEMSNGSLKDIIGITYDPIVSSDVVRSTLSGLVDGLATMGINNKKIKLIIWFDNGWGYAARIIDTIKKLDMR
jgi:glyceraldehyde 3-phosphate dehydrogenase|tara:strand:+ start:4125 stop:5126 length:1002 start_codon:yes stop_codon:yes gene_type:complete